MNSYYIADKQVFIDNCDLFHQTLGAHYIDLPSGKILISAHFQQTHAGIEKWESLSGVNPLPHPLFAPATPLPPAAVTVLSSLGIVTGHTVMDVIKAASAIHPLFKLRAI
jgi:hypothetical protein